MKHRRPAAVLAGMTVVFLITGCAGGAGSAQPESGRIAETSASAAPTVTPDTPVSATGTPVPVPDATLPATKAAVPIRKADAAMKSAVVPPVALDIEGTDISVKVIDVGIEGNGAMEIPESFWEAGWYRYGPAPGADTGNVVIAAHVDSLTEVMPFAQLKDVEIGAVVTVVLADGQTLAYEVTEVRNLPKATLDGSEIFKRDGPHLLKVITCGGDWLPEKGDYEDNIVLTATPL